MESKRLEELRGQIDEVDQKMFDLLRERMEIASQIGEIKEKNNLPIIDRKRREIALAKRLEYALKIGLPETEAREMFDFLHTIAVKVQEKIVES